jgi:hypothetical protein
LPRRQRAQRSWDIFREIGERIRSGRITPIRTAYDLAGEIDLVETMISIADLVQLAIDRRERPKHLKSRLSTSVVDGAAATGPTEHKRHGPEPGKLRRYDTDDIKLFPELERLMSEGRSRTGAERMLAERGEIAGPSTTALESKARRLAKLHKLHKSKPEESGN